MSISLPAVGADADAGQASRLTSRAQAPVRVRPDAKASAMSIRRGGTRETSYDTNPGGKTSPYPATQPPAEDETNSCRAMAQPPAAALFPMPASGRNIAFEFDDNATGRTCQERSPIISFRDRFPT